MSTEQAIHQADIWALLSDDDDIADAVVLTDHLL
jgi:hypothetical protein